MCLGGGNGDRDRRLKNDEILFLILSTPKPYPRDEDLRIMIPPHPAEALEDESVCSEVTEELEMDFEELEDFEEQGEHSEDLHLLDDLQQRREELLNRDRERFRSMTNEEFAVRGHAALPPSFTPLKVALLTKIINSMQLSKRAEESNTSSKRIIKI